MDLGLALQARSLERVATETLPRGAQPVPDDINRRLAGSMVRHMMGPRPGWQASANPLALPLALTAGGSASLEA